MTETYTLTDIADIKADLKHIGETEGDVLCRTALRVIEELEASAASAGQEARAVALQEAADVIKPPRFCAEDQLQRAEALHETRHAILALLDTPAAEALERVRAEEREATLRAAVDEIRDAPDLELARDRLIALVHSQPIRARGET